MIEENVSIEEIRRGVIHFDDGGKCVKVQGRTFVKLYNSSEIYEKLDRVKRQYVGTYIDEQLMFYEIWKYLNRDYFLQQEEFKNRSRETIEFIFKIFVDIDSNGDIDVIRDNIDEYLNSFKTIV